MTRPGPGPQHCQTGVFLLGKWCPVYPTFLPTSTSNTYEVIPSPLFGFPATILGLPSESATRISRDDPGHPPPPPPSPPSVSSCLALIAALYRPILASTPSSLLTPHRSPLGRRTERPDWENTANIEEAVSAWGTRTLIRPVSSRFTKNDWRASCTCIHLLAGGPRMTLLAFNLFLNAASGGLLDIDNISANANLPCWSPHQNLRSSVQIVER